MSDQSNNNNVALYAKIKELEELVPKPIPSKVIKDPIHGLIKLNAELFKIIDTPIFQRLRDLKQLGGMYFVFPGASHNRFEHCLGTCYLAGQWMRHFRGEGTPITEREIFLVEVAALCHDLGHGPFSHTFEDVIVKKLKIKWDHEEASCVLLEKINHETKLLSPEELKMVQSMITGYIPAETKPEKRFLWEIVHNRATGIDVDKFDYLQRDCEGAHLNLGVDITRLMQFSRVKGGTICFNASESWNLYLLFENRFSLHKQVYSHRVVKAVELMIGDVLCAADSYLGISNALNNKNYDFYVTLTDSIIKEIERSTASELANAKKIVDRIQRRKLYTLLGEVPVEKEFSTQVKDLAAKLDTFLTNKGCLEFIVCPVKYDFGKGSENPLKDVNFYEGESVSVKSSANIGVHMPSQVIEAAIRVFSSSQEAATQEKIYSSFSEWTSDEGSSTTAKIKPSPKRKGVRTEIEERGPNKIPSLNFNQE